MTLTRQRPLDGIFILDLTANVAGPLCTQVLADLGAHVVKVEPHGGDAARRITAFDASGEPMQPYFVPYNRGKTSIVLDLRSDVDKEHLLELVARADVFVQGGRPGSLARLGLGPEAVQERNSRCIYASLSAYGGEGELGSRPGVDVVVQAEAGCTTGLQDSDGAPVTVPFQLVDGATGHVLAQAILASLFHRERHGVADEVSVSMYDVACSLQANHLTRSLNQQPAAPRAPGARPADAVAVQPSGIYPAADGYLALAAYAPGHWRRLTEVVGRREWQEDPRFVDQDSRLSHRVELRRELSAILRGERVHYWVQAMAAVGLMAVRVRKHDDVVTSHIFAHNELSTTTLQDGRPVRTLRTPARYASFEAPTGQYVPRLGESDWMSC